jgi:hypothetical protein
MRTALTRAALGLAIITAQTQASAQPPAEDAPHVRVLSTNGILREGRLLQLTSSDAVLLLDTQTVRLPLTEVRRITRVTHGARNGVLAGTLSGLGLGFWLTCASRGQPEGGCSEIVALMFAGIGAGIGTAVGLLNEDARRSSNVMYAAPDTATRRTVPTVVLAGGAGGILRRRGREITAPAFQGSVQVPLSHRISLDVEATHWSWHRTRQIGAIADEAWRTLSLSTNVGWRIGTPAKAATIAMGAGVQRSTLHQSLCFQDCHALPHGRTFAQHFVETTPLALIGGGAETTISRRLTAFGSVRLVMGKESGLATFGGVRVPVGGRAVLAY